MNHTGSIHIVVSSFAVSIRSPRPRSSSPPSSDPNGTLCQHQQVSPTSTPGPNPSCHTYARVTVPVVGSSPSQCALYETFQSDDYPNSATWTKSSGRRKRRLRSWQWLWLSSVVVLDVRSECGIKSLLHGRMCLANGCDDLGWAFLGWSVQRRSNKYTWNIQYVDQLLYSRVPLQRLAELWIT